MLGSGQPGARRAARSRQRDARAPRSARPPPLSGAAGGPGGCSAPAVQPVTLFASAHSSQFPNASFCASSAASVAAAGQRRGSRAAGCARAKVAVRHPGATGARRRRQAAPHKVEQVACAFGQRGCAKRGRGLARRRHEGREWPLQAGTGERREQRRRRVGRLAGPVSPSAALRLTVSDLLAGGLGPGAAAAQKRGQQQGREHPRLRRWPLSHSAAHPLQSRADGARRAGERRGREPLSSPARSSPCLERRRAGEQLQPRRRARRAEKRRHLWHVGQVGTQLWASALEPRQPEWGGYDQTSKATQPVGPDTGGGCGALSAVLRPAATGRASASRRPPVLQSDPSSLFNSLGPSVPASLERAVLCKSGGRHAVACQLTPVTERWRGPAEVVVRSRHGWAMPMCWLFCWHASRRGVDAGRRRVHQQRPPVQVRGQRRAAERADTSAGGDRWGSLGAFSRPQRATGL